MLIKTGSTGLVLVKASLPFSPSQAVIGRRNVPAAAKKKKKLLCARIPVKIFPDASLCPLAQT